MEHRTKSYLQLVKPGITLSNTMTAVAGFLLAKSNHGFVWPTFLGLIGGIAFVIASACVVNNIIDRDLDSRMARTKKREIASGQIAIPRAAMYAVILGAIGFTLLAAFTNWIVFALGLLSYFWYVVVYGLAKRTTPLSTIIGGVCGALPPVAGYVAVTGAIDLTAVILFAIMMVWQLPHFYAISIFRVDDYKSAMIPVWSVKYGLKSTKAQILFWAGVYALLVPLLTLVYATGITYLIVMALLAIYWIFQGVRYYASDPDERWAKRMFGVSLLVLLAFSATIATGHYLP
jgi:protoheme IX farnesyltransferase